MGVYLSRCLVRQGANKNRSCLVVTTNDSFHSNRIELDSFALLNQFLTSHQCAADTFTVPTFMKYRILEDFVLFLHQRQIKLCANYTNESVIPHDYVTQSHRCMPRRDVVRAGLVDRPGVGRK
jgi:hypothetical protein